MRALPRRHIPIILCATLAAAAHAYAQAPTVLGYWRVPGGSVILVSPCDHGLCVQIAMLSSRSPVATDRHNPDPRLRNRVLCGLRIGEGFVEVDPQHARSGRLYDPRSGRTYSGQMTADGNFLHLRGYVGWPIFGRTATWVRASQPRSCAASH